MREDKQFTYSATLDLVCPPIPNSWAAQVTENKAAEAIIRQSDFYMICGRAVAKLGDIQPDETDNCVLFSIEVAGGKKDFGWIRIDQIPYVIESPNDLDLRLSYADEQIRFFDVKADGDQQIIAAFTPDDVLMRRGRKESLVGGFDLHLELATYDSLRGYS